MATNQPVQTVIVDRPGATPSGDVTLVKLQPVVSILIRAGRTFLQSLLGMLTIMVGTQMIPYDGFLDLFVTAASLAVAPTAFSLIQNTIELLSRLDETNAALRA